MLDQQYTPAEAAKISRRHVVTIRRELVEKRLHGTQRVDGGRWLISEGCLSAYMRGEKCEHQSVSNVTPMRRAVAS